MFQGKSKFQGNFSSVVEHFQDIKYDQTCVNDSEIYFVTIAPIAFQPGNQLVYNWFIPCRHLGTNRASPTVLIRAIVREPLGLWVLLGKLGYDWEPIGLHLGYLM